MTLVVIQSSKRPRRRAPTVPTGPVGGLMDPRFVHTPPLETNIRATFKRVRAEMAKGQRL